MFVGSSLEGRQIVSNCSPLAGGGVADLLSLPRHVVSTPESFSHIIVEKTDLAQEASHHSTPILEQGSE
jgi:hypothetical protein